MYSYIIAVLSLILIYWSTIFAQDIAITFTWWCLTWVWTDCMVIDSGREYTPMSIAQDVILGWTYMVWTVLTIVIIYCWLWYIFASRDGKDVSKFKKWLIYACIWALFVRWAYAIVRLIQYIAQW